MFLDWRARIAAFLLFLSASSAGAAVWYVPGTANISGRNGTHFSSDLEILNRGSAPTLLTFDFVALSGAAPPASVKQPVLPGETFVATNALAGLWSLSETAGTIRVEADQPLLISARTYNDASAGATFGTSLESVADADLLLPDDVGHAPWVSDSPDAATGFRSNVGVFLSLPGSSVDIVFFDAAGNEKGRRNVSGGPMAFQTSVSSIAPGGLAVGRAEFRVRAGKATGYVAVVDNVTGDSSAVSTTRTSGPLQAAINGVAHAPGREGTYFETDVRLFNTSAAQATVQVTPLALGNVAPVSVTLAPNEVKEIGDVLGTLFHLPDGAAGALRFFSFDAVMVLARTSNVHQDGTPGTFGALQKPVPLTRFFGDGTTVSLIGLTQTSAKPGYRTNVGFLAGPAASSARLVLRNRTGATLATNDPGVSLPANGWSQPSLQTLFPGVTIPEDAALDVLPTSGTFDVFSSVIDNTTGDSVITPAAPFVPYHCASPQVYSFFAESSPLAGPGTATLRWYSDADSVQISPGSGGLASSGTLPVNVTSTATYTLEATNACGTTTRTAQVVVGAPLAPALDVSSGTPGQLVRISAANVADLRDVTGVLLAFPDGVSLYAGSVLTDGSGSFVAVIPFQPEADVPGGYRQGPCTVSLVLHGNQPDPGAPFTIAPLALPADPSASLRSWVDQIAGAARSGIDPIASFDGGAAARDILNARIDTIVATLDKAADDIASSGSAVLPSTEPTAGQPVPALTTVSRDQLAAYVAFLDALSASEKVLAASRQPLASIPCLKDDPQIKFCVLAAAAGEIFDPLKLFNNDNNAAMGVANFKNCLTDVTQVAVYAMASRISMLLQLPTIICPLMTVWLDSFSAKPNQIPQDLVSTVSIYAALKRLSSQEQLASQLAQDLAQALLGKFSKLPYQCASAIANIIAQVVQDAKNFYQSAIDDLLAKLNLPDITTPTRTVQVSRCDIILASGNVSLVELTAEGCPQQGDPDYCLRGYSPGGSTLLKVIASPASFMFPDQRFKSYVERPPYDVPITIGPDQPSLVSNIFSGAAGYPDKVLTPGDQLSISGDDGSAHFELKVSRDAPKAWKTSMSVSGGPSLGPSTYITATLSMPGFAGGQFEAFVNASGSLTAPTEANYSYEWSGQLRSLPETATFGQQGPVSNGPKTLDTQGIHALINNPSSGELKGFLGGFVGTNTKNEPGSFSFQSSVSVTYKEAGQ